MNYLFLSSSLGIAAAYLIVASNKGDEAKALNLSKIRYRKFSANIDDRSKLRDRLLELNRTGQHVYLEFRSSQVSTTFLTFTVFALFASSTALLGPDKLFVLTCWASLNKSAIARPPFWVRLLALVSLIQ